MSQAPVWAQANICRPFSQAATNTATAAPIAWNTGRLLSLPQAASACG